MAHRHYYKRCTYNGKETTEKCACGKMRTRPTTDAERKKMDDDHDESMKLHALWHKFTKKFMSDGYTFNEHGADLQDQVEKFAKKHPEIIITRCDDSYFSCSDLVFIHHENEKEYMGTTLVYIPQCSGDPPAVAFLYPQHVYNLIKTLKIYQKKADKKPGKTWKMLKKILKKQKP